MAEAVDDRRGYAVSAARWCVVVLLSVIAACLVIELGFGSGVAGAQPVSAGETSGLVAIAGQVGTDAYGIFLIDTRSRTMCLYRYLATVNKLQFLAARNVSYDLQLDDYNNAAKTPREIKEIVEKQKRLDEVKPQK